MDVVSPAEGIGHVTAAGTEVVLVDDEDGRSVGLRDLWEGDSRDGDDTVVLASGVVEVALGAALATARRRRVWVGRVVAAFFVAVFPGNIAQWRDHRDAFGLDTDEKRFARLFFQPVLVWLALWSTRRG